MNMLFLCFVYEYTTFTLKAHANCKTDDYFRTNIRKYFFADKWQFAK